MIDKYSLSEALGRSLKPILVSAQNDDGSWHEYSFANEAAAQEYERKWAKRGVLYARRSY